MANTAAQEFFDKKLQEELEAHAELQELEEGDSKAGSAAPSGQGVGTPQPSSGTRIKIISSSARASEAANGTKSAAQSDEE
jgi:hypothetical protein